MGWDLLVSLGRKFADAVRAPGARRWLLVVALTVGFLVDVGLVAFKVFLPDVADVVGAVVILVLPGVFLLVGLDRAASDDPIRKLFEAPYASEAPYLLSCAADLHRDGRVAPSDKRRAIEELAGEMQALKNENQYIREAITEVETHSVWAICGRKTDANAPNFYKANENSLKEKGNYIERVFFPPDTADEAVSIRKAIKDYHLPLGMLVRALANTQDPAGVRNTYKFPPGFGMTIMGELKRRDGNPCCDPESKVAVLIHWGGVSHAATHFGVILRERAWLDFFWNVFEQVRGTTEIVNEGGCSMTWKEFTRIYPSYIGPPPSRGT